MARFRELRQNEDLRDQKWQDQPRFDEGGRARGEFHLEHIYTGSMFRAAVDRMEIRTPEKIIKLVEDNYRLAWILKSENGLLPRSIRGTTLQDALRVYEECGVKLVRPYDQTPLSD